MCGLFVENEGKKPEVCIIFHKERNASLMFDNTEAHGHAFHLFTTYFQTLTTSCWIHAHTKKYCMFWCTFFSPAGCYAVCFLGLRNVLLFFSPLPLDVLIVVCRWYQHVSTICNLKHCSLTNSMGGSQRHSLMNGWHLIRKWFWIQIALILNMIVIFL